MKRLFTSLLLVFTLCFSFSTAQAKTVKYGYIQFVEKQMGPFYSLSINGKNIDTPVLPVKDEGCLVVPLRPVIEGLGGTISWNSKDAAATAVLGGKEIIFKMNADLCIVNNQEKPTGRKITTIDGATVVPLKILFDVFDIDVQVDSGKGIMSIQNMGYKKDVKGITGMKYLNMDSGFELRVSMDQDYKSEVFKVAAAENLPERIAVRIYGLNKDEGQVTFPVNGVAVQTFRYTRFDNDIIGMALDLNGSQNFEVNRSATDLQIKVGDVTQPPKEGSDTTPGNNAESGNTENTGNEGVVRKNLSYRKDGEKIASLFLEGIVLQPGTFDIWKAVDGTKLVLNVKKAAGVPKDDFFNLKDGVVNTISSRYNRLTEDTKITIETPGSCEYEIVPVTTGNIGTNIVVKAPVPVTGSWVNTGKKNILDHGNITYHSNGDRTAIILNKVKLTEGSKTMTRLYTPLSLNNGKTLQFTFQSKYGSLPSGTVPVYDGTVEDIVLNTNRLTGKSTVTINMTEPMAYNVVYRYDVDSSTITLLKPAKWNDRLVVIDAGHGGKEVGAVYNGVYEKNLNLDIALTVQSILEARGVNTYMIREDDSYVGLYERANIANALNASLFVSIHNNALENNKNINGSMVFYHGSSSQGKALSKTILNRLVKDLKMPDRGIREQSEYIVLQGTAMPSALVEVAFMSGEIDFTLLTTAHFRAKAAEAIADGIMDYMGR
ncbi:MAG TPA: hypothetical protein DDZ89_06355 [Clostridiales bacterium]|nr:hypothetical protein [Clostridiales bacterium]